MHHQPSQHMRLGLNISEGDAMTCARPRHGLVNFRRDAYGLERRRKLRGRYTLFECLGQPELTKLSTSDPASSEQVNGSKPYMHLVSTHMDGICRNGGASALGCVACTMAVTASAPDLKIPGHPPAPTPPEWSIDLLARPALLLVGEHGLRACMYVCQTRFSRRTHAWTVPR